MTPRRGTCSWISPCATLRSPAFSTIQLPPSSPRPAASTPPTWPTPLASASAASSRVSTWQPTKTGTPSTFPPYIFRLETSTQPDGANQFVNTLNPHIELYDPANILVATGSALLDGRNEALLFLHRRRPVIIASGSRAKAAPPASIICRGKRRSTGIPTEFRRITILPTAPAWAVAGIWDTSSPVWFNGVSDVAWNNANNDVAAFLGTSTGGTGRPPGNRHFGQLLSLCNNGLQRST